MAAVVWLLFVLVPRVVAPQASAGGRVVQDARTQATRSVQSQGYKGATAVTDSGDDRMSAQCNRGRSADLMLHRP
jgi:hypothetical protein